MQIPQGKNQRESKYRYVQIYQRDNLLLYMHICTYFKVYNLRINHIRMLDPMRIFIYLHISKNIKYHDRFNKYRKNLHDMTTVKLCNAVIAIYCRPAVLKFPLYIYHNCTSILDPYHFQICIFVSWSVRSIQLGFPVFLKFTE